jgi:PadR family transcriptional regulator, regulatory protein AphA
MSHRHLILGLLSESPMTGYEIKKRLCETMSMIASPSYGAVYPTLHRLLNEGAVTVDVVKQEGRPPKKVYAIAEAGREELETWLREPAVPDRVTREFLLKMLLAHRLPPEHLKAHLGRRRRETEDMCQVLEQLDQQPGKQMNGQHSWVIEYAKVMCEAEIGWLNRVEQSLRESEEMG